MQERKRLILQKDDFRLTHKLPVQNFSNGTYIVRLITDKGIVTGKLIVQ